jgi:hypothetical protein
MDGMLRIKHVVLGKGRSNESAASERGVGIYEDH